MTHFRQLMLDELQRRNYSPSTVRCYIHAVEDFSKHFHRSPERLGPGHIREYQVHLFRDRKLSAGAIQSRYAALRFLFVETLRARTCSMRFLSQAAQEAADRTQPGRASASD